MASGEWRVVVLCFISVASEVPNGIVVKRMADCGMHFQNAPEKLLSNLQPLFILNERIAGIFNLLRKHATTSSSACYSVVKIRIIHLPLCVYVLQFYSDEFSFGWI